MPAVTDHDRARVGKVAAALGTRPAVGRPPEQVKPAPPTDLMIAFAPAPPTQPRHPRANRGDGKSNQRQRSPRHAVILLPASASWAGAVGFGDAQLSKDDILTASGQSTASADP
jgi:hypothetical protein